jgi:hypothetical protein
MCEIRVANDANIGYIVALYAGCLIIDAGLNNVYSIPESG